VPGGPGGPGAWQDQSLWRRSIRRRFPRGGGGFNSQLDEQTLEEIAKITDGKYFHATETDQCFDLQELNRD